MIRHRRGAVVLAGLGLVLVLAVLLGVGVGALRLAPGSVLATLAQRTLGPVGVDVPGGLDPTASAVLLQLRLPRVLLAAVVGAALAIAGAGYQGVFRNPLADPYLLGAAGGAGLGATVVISLSPVRSLGPVGLVPVAAFVGALVGVGASFLLARAVGGSTGATLLLSGVAVASFLGAAQTLLQQQRTESLREVYGWILGQLGAASWSDLGLLLPYLVPAVVVLLVLARPLDVLAVGDEEARTLGLDPARVRLLVIVAASLATASAVAVSGLIGFVGLVVPHLVRGLVGPGHRLLLPACLLGGAVFLVLADALARTVLAPAELPIGVVTAFVGAPFFAGLLVRGARR